MPETYGYFYVECGDVDPGTVTALLGITPSEVYRKGDPHPHLKDRYRSGGGWKLLSPLPQDSYFLNEHLEALVDLLLPVAEKIRTMPVDFERGINCVGYYTRENPGFHLSRELQRKLVQLDLEIDFDEYLSCDMESPWEHITLHKNEPIQPLQGTPAKSPSSSTEPEGRRS